MRVAVLAVILATVFAVFAFQRTLGRVARVGALAPAFSLPDTSGQDVSLASLRGHVVLVDFWASWCTVCQQDAPVIAAFAQRYTGQVSVVGIDWQEPEATVRATARSWGLDFPNLRDADGAVAHLYGLTGVPEDWWIGPGGHARLHTIGALSFEQLQADYAKATGRPIDGAGVPPVASGGHAAALAAGAARLWLAVAGGPGAGLWSRPLAGGGWVRASLPGAITAVAAAGPDILAYGAGAGLRGSTDGGSSWQPVRGPGAPTALAAAGGRWYAWAGGRLWEAGAWTAGFQASAAPPLTAHAVDSLAARGAQVIAATAQGAFTWAGHGAWSALGLQQRPLAAGEFTSPAAALTGRQPLDAGGVVFSASGTAWLAGSDGLYRWSGGTGGRLAAAPARAFAAVAASAGALWAVAPNGDLYRSTDGGAAWALQSQQAARA